MPGIDGMERTITGGGRRCKAENGFSVGTFFSKASNGHWRRMRCRPYVSARPILLKKTPQRHLPGGFSGSSDHHPSDDRRSWTVLSGRLFVQFPVASFSTE
jgi:hypothetical protein